MARTWNDPAADRAYLDRANETWDRIQSIRTTVTPANAQAVSTMAANYPHMGPGLVVPLASAGVAPDDPLVQHVATASAKQNKRKRGVWGALGDIVHAPAFLGNLLARDVLDPLGDAGLSALKWGSRTGTTVLGAGPELLAAGVRDVAAVAGNIGAGVASGAAVGGAIGVAGGPFAPISVAAGAIGGAVVGGIGGALAEARGVDIASEGVVNPFAQTTLGQQLTGHSAGSGYFAAGAAHEEAAKAQRAAASISGRALTPGRFLASSVVEPGTAPYNLVSGLLDTAVTWQLDPTQKVLHGAGKYRKSAKAFVPENLRAEVGLVDAARKTILPEKIDVWLNSKQGAHATQWLADQTDFDLIRRQLGGGKVDVSTVLDLTNARTPEEVAAILRPQLGLARGLELKPRVGTAGFEVKRIYQDSARVFNEMPAGRLDLNDPTGAVEEFDRLQRTAKIDHPVISTNNQAFAQALVEGDTLAAKRIVYDQFWGGESGVLAKHNVLPEMRRKLAAELASNDQIAGRRFVEETATRTAVPAITAGGVSQPLANPGFLAAGTEDVLSFDRDAVRNIRRVTGRFPDLMTSKKWTVPVAAADHLLTDLWKPLQLIRGAWTTRVVGEEQLRMSVAGESSMFKHPLSHLSWMLADDGKVAGIFKKFGVDISGHTGVGNLDATGERFAALGSTITPNPDLERELLGAAREFADATNVRAQAEGWLDGTNVLAKHQAVYKAGDPNFHQAWAEQIDALYRDPVTRRLAAEPTSAVRRWFAEGEGSQLRQELVDKYRAPLRSNADIDRHIEAARRNLNEGIGVIEGPAPMASSKLLGGLSADEAGAEWSRAVAASPGNPAIREAIATGELDGIPLHTPSGTINKDFVEKLRTIEGGPGSVIGDAVISAGAKDAMKATLDTGVRRLFSAFMAVPSAKLSRSPMFRQTYWKEAENVVFAMDETSKARLLGNAAEAKLPAEQLKRLRARAALGTGDTTLDEADLLLKGRAIDSTQKLLYDTAQRGQLSDVMRLVAPFAEAQKEVFKVWAKIGTEHPEVFRRTQQVIEGARGSGFFHTDPATGEEMFTFPGSQILTEKTLGVPVPLSGRVQGLNVFGSGILPGLGPAIQIPAGWMLPDKPQFDHIRKLIDPYGATSTESEGLLESQLPSWFQKIRTAISAPESDRVFANAIKDIWASGVSSGKYSADTPEDIKEGLDDAKTKARILYAIRGVSSVTGLAPTTLSPEFMAMDKHQHWIVTEKLAQDYQKMLNDDPDSASSAFLDKYGNNAFAFLQAKSYATTAAAPTSTDAAQWLRTNQEVTDKYGDVAGLFAPQGQDFDYQMYLRNLKSGATVSLTPDQFAKAANDKLGKMVFYNQKDRFGPSPSKEQRAWLTDLRQVLREEFPGFDETLPGKPNSSTVTQKFIPQVQKAVEDPALADNEVAHATKLFLAGRAKMEAAAKNAGFATFTQAKAMAPQREWLRTFGEMIVEEIPDFEPMFSRIFDREMVDDAQSVSTGVGPQ